MLCKICVLIIIGWLLEGFDHKPVSVLGIVRNVAPTSWVLFAQFVVRAVRKNNPDDPTPAQIVTHTYFNQLQNYETFEMLAEVDPTDDDNWTNTLLTEKTLLFSGWHFFCGNRQI